MLIVGACGLTASAAIYSTSSSNLSGDTIIYSDTVSNKSDIINGTKKDDTIPSDTVSVTKGDDYYHFEESDGNKANVKNADINDTAKMDTIGGSVNQINDAMDGMIYNNEEYILAEQFNYGVSTRYPNPPAKPGTVVKEFYLTKSEGGFVRVYDNAHSVEKGNWIVKADKIEGLTPEQIKAELALDYTPTMISDVNVPSGTKLD